jgi:hypothetical protein
MRRIFGLLLLVLPLAALAQNAVNGTWKIDLNKLQMDEKPSVYELKNGEFTCSSCVPKYTIKADGEYHAVQGNPYSDQISAKIVDPHTVEISGMKGDRLVFREMNTISDDGKTVTQKYEGHPTDSAQPVTATGIFSRIGEAQPGAHLLSGSWKPEKVESASDNALSFRYTTTRDGVDFRASTGEHYSAKFDGKEYPFHGDPGTTSVSLHKIDANTFEETYRRNGEVTGNAQITISPDGKTMTLVSHDARRNTTDRMVAERANDGSSMADK